MLHPRDYELSPGGIYEPRRRVLRPKQLNPGIVAGGGSVPPIVIAASGAAHVFGQSTDSNNITTSGSPIDTRGSNLLVAWLAGYQQMTAGAFSDSKSNSWTRLATVDDGGGTNSHQCFLFYCANPTTDPAQYFIWTGDGSGLESPSMAVVGFTNVVLTSPFDQQNGHGATGTPGTLQPGSITPGSNNELIVAGLEFNALSGTASIDSGFSIIDQAPINVSDNGEGFAIAWKVQTTAAPINPTWTAPGTALVSGIYSFKHA